jgi:HlyD family secretion protein
MQHTRAACLTRSNIASPLRLDQAVKDVAAARADVAAAEANYAAAQRRADSGANAQVQAAAATLAVLERRLDKTIVRAPADGIVTVRPRSSQA